MTLEEQIQQLLVVSLDSGISEFDFWDMTPAELVRMIESKNRIKEREYQDKASFDYIQSQLIIKGISILLGDKDNNFPSIQEAYPQVFAKQLQTTEEEKQKRKDELSALRFKQFVQSFNKRMENKEVPKADNE